MVIEMMSMTLGRIMVMVAVMIIEMRFKYLTRPSALGKSDPFCGPSNPTHLFTKDYTIFCRPYNPQYLFPKNYAIFF